MSTWVTKNKLLDAKTLLGASDLPIGKIVEAAHAAFNAFLLPNMIKIDTDYMWQPISNRPAMPAIGFPPHAAFDVQVEMPPTPI